MDLISKDYKDLLTKYHKDTRWGARSRDSSPKWRDCDKPLLEAGISTCLDFGCGHGGFVKAGLPGIKFSGYDPCIPEYSTKPTTSFDGLVSFDVLEHIEPEFIDETLKWLDTLFTRIAVLDICGRPANAILPDGRNAHLIIENQDWWRKKLEDNIDATITKEWTYSKNWVFVLEK